VIGDADLRELARRIVFAADEQAGPFTPARRARLLLAARQLVEASSPEDQVDWLRAFRARK
jgi:hypothetical protein